VHVLAGPTNDKYTMIHDGGQSDDTLLASGVPIHRGTVPLWHNYQILTMDVPDFDFLNLAGAGFALLNLATAGDGSARKLLYLHNHRFSTIEVK